MERATVRVDGVVQSVGFRPFVYRRATAHGLRGTVKNLGDAGVRITVEGAPAAIDALLADLRENTPPLARVEMVEVRREDASNPLFDAFDIVESGDGATPDDASCGTEDGTGGGTIPPDTAVCEQCLDDLRDSDSRYHGYWATSCVDCGPRFTVVEALPYDRPTTSMRAFPMCGDCAEEYENPTDRRYHAQTIACPQCGPRVRFGRPANGATDASTAVPDDGRDPFPSDLANSLEGHPGIEATARAIASGEVVVLKGIGGAHLACDATDAAAVQRLRKRTGRTEKPFALMAPNPDAVEGFAVVSEAEREELLSPRRPILLLNQRGAGEVVPGVAPGLHTVGVMLPYSGVHHLLFDHLDAPVVLTSANLPGRPMLTANATLVDGLADVADGFLLHDRRIVARCDDSVARVVDGERRLLRRSRGFAPTPVSLPGADDAAVLGVGPELDVTPGVLRDGDAYLVQYIGDVDTLETFEYFERAIDHLHDVSGIDHPPVVAHDAHPEFNTTDYARRLVREGVAERAVAVQHHHAHAASVLAEHDRDRAVALTLDGVGYGPDGTVWGGEILDASRAESERVGGLARVPMPGGDQATRHPGRLAAGLLHAADARRVAESLARHDVQFPGGADERDVVCQQLDADVNTPRTSSAGRFLDAVSALLGVCTERTYEGEPAMKLEALAARGTPRAVDVPRASVDGRPVVDTPALFGTLVDLLTDGTPRPDVAATAQATMARGLADLAVDAADELGQDTIVLSGGVAYNDHVACEIRQTVTAAGRSLLGNEQVPAGDGGVAYGQLAAAAARLE